MGGGTSSNPTVPSIFDPLITASIGQETQQQGLNPLSQYDAGNPMGVQGLTPSQQAAMSYTAGGLQQSPLLGLAAQAAQNMGGMAGAGPLSYSYNPNNSMGLQQWMQLLNPSTAQGGEMGTQIPQNTTPTTVPPNPGGGGQSTYTGPGYTSGTPPTGGSTAQNPSRPLPTGANIGGGSNPANTTSPTASTPWAQMTPQQQRAAAMADNVGGGGLSGLEQILGPNWRQNALSAPQVNIPGLSYTGANHELGGNNAIGQAAAQAGMTPQQVAQWTAQGYLHSQQNPVQGTWTPNGSGGLVWHQTSGPSAGSTYSNTNPTPPTQGQTPPTPPQGGPNQTNTRVAQRPQQSTLTPGAAARS